MNELADQTKSQTGGLRNHFLIAMPTLNGSIFSHTITYICDHSDEGAMGLVINQPFDLSMTDIFSQMGIQGPEDDAPILCGGPVQPERGFILHSPEASWSSSLAVSDDIMLTASRDIIEAMANGKGPLKRLIALGYAGWSAGQLEEEILANSWLTVPADSSIIFDTPIDQRWATVAQNLGIDLNLISSTAGHA